MNIIKPKTHFTVFISSNLMSFLFCLDLVVDWPFFSSFFVLVITYWVAIMFLLYAPHFIDFTISPLLSVLDSLEHFFLYEFLIKMIRIQHIFSWADPSSKWWCIWPAILSLLLKWVCLLYCYATLWHVLLKWNPAVRGYK